MLRVLIALAAVLAASGCGTEAPTSENPVQPQFRFEEAAGWQTDGTGMQTREPQVPIARAATLPLSDDPGSVPWDTVRQLPPDGIVIVVAAYHPYGSGPNGFPPRELPLQLGDAEVQESWEGQPNPEAPRYRIMAEVDGLWLEADVIFGTQRPSDEQAGRAQDELARLQLPA